MKFCFLIFFFLFTYETFAQSQNPDSTITGKLKKFFSIYVPEKAYLQFDKPYYAAGDTIYFKAYVTAGELHQLSEVSGVLHVDLISPENKINQSLKLYLDSGICWGDFALPDSLPAGNYRARAYTQWMRNLGDKDFFNRYISIGSSVKVHPPDEANQSPPSVKNEPDIQFFPEGGSFVSGIRTKVAFKAISPTGLGEDVTGVILDDKNNEICQFASSHLGMGYFFLDPSDSNRYKAQVTFGDGTRSIVDLPTPKTYGVSLSVDDNPGPKVSFVIKSNHAFYDKNYKKDFLLFIYSAGKAITYALSLDAATIALDIEKRLLRTGITRATLFSAEGEPLCERLLFVKNKTFLRLSVHADKPDYTKREKVNMQFNANDSSGLPASGHFSVSVIDENKVPANEADERNILTNMLLTSDLKGYVEQPNYYFYDTSDDARRNLDLLMLTQGYTSFDWATVLNDNYAPLAYRPERGLEINGRVTRLSGKPVKNGTVTLIPSNGGPIVNSLSDSMGIFHFPNVVFIDTMHFVMSAVDSNGKNDTKITFLNMTNISQPAVDLLYRFPNTKDTVTPVYVDNAEKALEESARFGAAKVKVLKTAIVTTRSRSDQYRTQSLAGAGHADQVMHTDEIERVSGQLSTSLNGRLLGVGFLFDDASYTYDIPYLKSATTDKVYPMMVVVDGVVANVRAPSGHITGYGINALTVSDIETIEVLKYSSTSMYGMDGANGVLVITTKNGDDRRTGIAAIGILPITLQGFDKAATFYCPKYAHADVDSNQHDLRSTIYWNPEIKTGKDGTASFDYYNADGTGTYKMIIEGIDDKGHLGRLVYKYEVK